MATETTDTAYDAAIEYARALGALHGRNAASWYFDGNTPTATYRAALQGIEDGDPAVLDTFPTPDLSGEWADSMTGPMLVNQAIWHATHTVGPTEDGTDWSADICDAYEMAFSTAVEDAIASAARAILR